MGKAFHMAKHERQQRLHMLVGGQVQGVGFRPFVYRCAMAHGLTGHVGNTTAGVEIQVQGITTAIAAFQGDFQHSLPPLARVHSCEKTFLPLLQNEAAFTIIHSDAGGGGHSVLVSPDVALCADCLADITGPHNRRYAYPFTNCTNCGPRYTITRSIPYDRASTSMACFPLCPDCGAEYANPLDRRFHAQPNACPLCGPKLWVVDTGNTAPPPAPHENPPSNPQADTPLHAIAVALYAGRIAAIKGLGGFQLACNALDADAVALLRQRKNRPHKALAVMVPDMATARLVAECSPEQEALLQSAEAPIVLCRKHSPQTAMPLAPSIAPDAHNVGLMLPYTPLHRVLLQAYAAVAGPQAVALVMTSANAGGEPICLGNREALSRLQGLADIFLLHNRDILVRADDSVVAFSEHTATAIMYRRARGYVPRPVTLAQDGPCVLGVGAELKATLCLTRGKAAFVSQHIGDVHNIETFGFYQEIARHLELLLEVQPEAIVRDLHPDYMTSHYAQKYAQEKGTPLFFLQHHAAHGWSVLTENAHCGPALVWALDGSGLGTAANVLEKGTVGSGLGTAANVLEKGTVGSGLGTATTILESGAVETGLASSNTTIENDPALGGPWQAGAGKTNTHSPALWGGELLYIDTSTTCQRRVGRLVPFPLPGGDAAAREPWRVAQGLLTVLDLPWTWPAPQQQHAPFITAMVRKNVQCPPCSSMGRLFDAVSALLGLCLVTSYEGQAALRLQEAQEDAPENLTPYPVPIIPPARHRPHPSPHEFCPAALADGAAHTLIPLGTGHPELWQWDSHRLFAHIHADMLAKVPVPHIARKFHLTLADGLSRMAAQVARSALYCHVQHVGLAGGVLQNPSLAYLLPRALAEQGLTALSHHELPPNDGSIALGQAAYGRAMLLAHKG